MIIINQSPTRVKQMIGYDESNRKIINLDFMAMRKPSVGARQVRDLNGRKYFVIVSNPNFKNIFPGHINPICWMHCYREKSNRLPKNAPHILMSESDFVDPISFPTFDRKPDFDYTYFSGNDYPSGYRYKGFDVFLQILPTLNDMKLKGRLILYVGTDGEWRFPMTPTQRKLLNRSVRKKRLNIKFKKLPVPAVARVMAKSGFCLFPNKEDCSPRMIAESIINNTPVVVNQQIDGGWKYPEKNPLFGATFNPLSKDSIEAAVRHALSIEGDLAGEWQKEYGFWNSSRKMADYLRPFGVIPDGITHVYFKEFSRIFKKGMP